MDWSHPLRSVIPTLESDVLQVLAGASAEFSGREIQRMSGRASHEGVRRALDRLVDAGIVSSRTAGRAKMYALNRDHVAAPAIEQLAQMRSTLVQRLRDFVSSWSDPPIVAAIFGSTARADGSGSSDIDILLVRPSTGSEDEWGERVVEVMERVHAWTGNDARTIVLGAEELDEPEWHPLMDDIVRDGIWIVGSARGMRQLSRRA